MEKICLTGKLRDTSGIKLERLIKEQAASHMDKTAVKCRNYSFTYRQMECLTDKFAAYLQKLGVGKETLVGIYMDRSSKMVLSVLSVLKAGGAYVPLDPAHPEDRNRNIIQQTEMKYLITQKSYADKLEEDGRKLILIDADWDEIINDTELSLPEELSSGDHQLAYVIFTSGSTGKPKGVEIEHEGMVNYLLSVSDELSLDDSVTGLSVVTITFDISISELFLPLINGGTLVVADNEESKDGSLIAELMRNEKITLGGFTPSTAFMILESGWDDLTGIKLLIGGEPWNMELAETILKRGCAGLWNVYGPTETTIYSAVSRISSGDKFISIGSPVDQTDLYVLDEKLEPANEGELYIGGIGVARGYYKNPELTSEKFISSPFEPEKRIYGTGDLVKKIDENTIVYISRKDFQVKVRGFRIELGEVEAAAAGISGVEQAVAVVTGEEYETKLCVFIKMLPGYSSGASEIKTHLENILPYYMVPGIISFIDEFPMTSNMKVDRKKLTEIVKEDISTGSEFIEPRNEIEEEIVNIWKEVLDIKKISVLDDFLELGGHSLLANRLVIRINKAFGTGISLIDVLSRKMTVEEMANLVEEDLISGLSEEDLEALMAE